MNEVMVEMRHKGGLEAEQCYHNKDNWPDEL